MQLQQLPPGAATVPPPVQQQQPQEVLVQSGAVPVLQPGGPQPTGGPAAGGGDDVDFNMGEKELLDLGASLEAIEGWRAVARLQKARGQRSGPYGEPK